MSRRLMLCTAFLAVLGTALIPAPTLAGLGDTERVSVSSTGAQDNHNSFYNSISADGRYVAFESDASDLVAGDTNGVRDIFLHDRVTGATTRVSVSSSGEQGNSYSYYPSISADGRYIAFESYASNLVAGDTNGCPDVFVYDRVTRETERVSVSYSGAQGNGGSYGPTISADGQYVAFGSLASNLIHGDTNGFADTYMRDRVGGSIERISVSSLGAQGNEMSFDRPAISADNRYVAFTSVASNLVPGDTNGTWDVFAHDRDTGATQRVSLSTSGDQGDNLSAAPSVSADGRCVAFYSWASTLVPGDTGGHTDVFVHDRVTGETERVSVSSSGEQGNDHSAQAAISADGRYVSFASYASNLCPGVPTDWYDVFVHDRVSGATERVAVSSSGAQGNGESFYSAISADGRYVAFASTASNLVPNDTNDCRDVFVHQYLPDPLQVTSPSGWLNPGWNYFSIPLTPTGSSEVSTIMGFDCENIVYRWDPVGKTFELYYSDFKQLDRGRGYLLWIMTTPHPPSYEAFAPTGDFEIALPEAGWTWIGQPFDHDTLLSGCSVINHPKGETRTATEDSIAASPWVNWSFLWWNSTVDSWDMLSLTGATNNSLIPWHGYLVWANTRDLTLIVSP